MADSIDLDLTGQTGPAGQTRRRTFRAAGALAVAAGGMALPAAGAWREGALNGLEAWLGQRVIGQDQVIATIGAALRRWSGDRPDAATGAASFLFLGPPRMGKTLLAKSLSERLFGPDAFTRVDLREVATDGGWVARLAEALRARPSQVVLLDEVHAAPPDAERQIRRMLETGQLSQGSGTPVSLRGTVVIAATTAQPAAWSGLDALRRVAGETVTFRRLSPEELETVRAMMGRR